MTPTRPALRWFGGKWRLAPWVIEHFPRHDAYVEPYGGAASVLLRKPPAKLETWNDLHGRLVNFFTVLREHPGALVKALGLTPYARTEYEQAREVSPDPLEDARRFWVLCWQARVGGAGDQEHARVHGWRYVVDIDLRRTAPTHELADLNYLHAIAARLRHVQIEHDEALPVLRRYDAVGVLHYVDPPYWDPSADLRSRYAYVMTEADHIALADVLHACAGMVVLSGRPSGLYGELYGNWQRSDRKSPTDSGQIGTESLWLNPAAAAAQWQLNLLEGVLL